MADRIVTDDIRDEINGAEFWQMRAWVEDLLPEVDRLRAENDRLRAVVLAGQEARAVEQDEPFDHEHAEAAWAAYDVAVERLEADRG